MNKSPVATACERVKELVERAGEHSTAPLDSDELVVYLREVQELANLGETALNLLCANGGALELLIDNELDNYGRCLTCGEKKVHDEICEIGILFERAVEELRGGG